MKKLEQLAWQVHGFDCATVQKSTLRFPGTPKGYTALYSATVAHRGSGFQKVQQ